MHTLKLHLRKNRTPNKDYYQNEKKILIVEDESIIAMTIAENLKEFGYKIVGMDRTAEEAISTALKKDVDLILMDIRLDSKLDGIEAAEIILKNKQIPIIYLTANSDQDYLDRAKYTFPYGYILKPFDERELRYSIDMALFKFDYEKKIRESEEKYRLLAENMNDLICLFNVDGSLDYSSPSVKNLFGLVSNSFNHKELHKLIHQDDLENIFIPTLRKVRNDVISKQVQFRIKLNNSIIWLETNFKPILDPKGDVILIQTVSREITQRKIAEKKLAENELLLRAALNNYPDIFVIYDKELRILFMNKAGIELTGLTEKEILGKKDEQIMDNDIVKVYKTYLTSALEERKYKETEATLKIHDNLYTFIIKYVPLFDEDGDLFSIIGIANDISKIKETQFQLKQAKDKAEELNEMKSNFLANMSHELRTPLIGILGYTQILSEEIEDSEYLSMLEKIIQSGKRLKDSLNLLLDLSKIEANKIDLLLNQKNIVDLVRETVDLFELTARKKGIYIRAEHTKKNISLITDERLLIKMLNNLISNAIEYTEKGGVTITTDEEMMEGEICGVIRIQDTGIGIPKDKLKLIFDEFRQVSEGYKRRYEGTGLGLTITKKLADMIKVVISLESKEKEGSIFTLRIPSLDIKLASEFAEQENLAQNFMKSEDESSNNKPSIIIVEDDFTNVDVMKLFLRKFCHIDSAPSADEALELIQKKVYDIVFMDINLGSTMDGISTMKEIRKDPRYLNIPIVAVTAYAMKGDKEKFINEGFTNYLSKPFDKNTFVNFFKEVLDNSKKSQYN